ncbi:SOS response-associated peptidase [Chitinophaga pendula]|uniref:SOS response-associated peptidase n=1 Tax=Chitinophaga TaxID=79328 RepID=UPI000BB03C0A|nr:MULTISPECIES: SOS response-associated peptidase family protein [Chitinophaga]ASZ13711.1 DUF159 family protein [Chitinophaga sp. MD30]UCJ08672.1 SOS response-associated peptidase [Chitinophaga pendula]
MCYDLSFSCSIDSIIEHLPEIKQDAGLFLEFEPAYHRVAQSYPRWPIIINSSGNLSLRRFEWGIIAPYMKTQEDVKKSRKWMVNARSEKIFDPKAYWNRIRNNRCLVATSGFFEHREIPNRKNKVPYFIREKGRDVFFIAGLYQYSHFPNISTGELPGTFTVITREANNVMRQIHNGGENAGRMPLLLPVELERHWLDPSLSDNDIKEILSYSIPSGQLEYWPVNSVRKAKEDNVSVITPFSYEGLPEIIA